MRVLGALLVVIVVVGMGFGVADAGQTWTRVGNGGFGDGDNVRARSMAVFRGWLYVGTGHNPSGAQIWAYDGSQWDREIWAGFRSAPDTRTDISSMAVFNGNLYAAAVGTEGIDGIGVWGSDGSSWRSAKGVAGYASGVLATYGNKLYLGTGYGASGNQGGQVWAYDGSDWSQVNVNGFGDPDNVATYPFVEFQGKLYAAA